MDTFYLVEIQANYKTEITIKDNFLNKNLNYIEIKRLNFFIGKNNSGKSRCLRDLFSNYLLHGYFNKFIYFENLLKKMDFKNIGRWNSSDLYVSKWFEDELKNSQKNKSISLIQLKKDLDVIKRAHGQFYTDYLVEICKENFDLVKNLQMLYYIPVLRGMRPVGSQESVYNNRTILDYFKDKQKISNHIITGESLFQELTEHLLGEPEQRQLIADYQKLLSQYFFDNQEITLIPKHGTDVVHIKIGNEPQFPIYQLGDGLQQAIILTYPVFLNNQDTHIFFIEEPELHMHAGMVRQLMNFYLNETKHYYFFTTHSNHLLDMADESDEVIIQKFVKQTDEQQNTSFQIYRCDRDRDLLASLGVKPSSVYLANCTIWVEGITDRLYLLKYMEKYLQELQNEQPEKYLQYRRFMPNYHYAFVEYSGGNIVHWDFSDDFADGLADKGLSAKAIASNMLLIADGDNREKAARLFEWNEELGEQNVVVLQSKEMENTLPFDVIMEVAKARFVRMQAETKMGFEIEKLDLLDKRDYFVHKTKGIGFLLDKQIRLPETDKKKSVFADGSVGTIKDKLKFCREVIQYFDNNPDWELTAEARELCERIFQHIYDANKCQTEPKT